MARMLGVVAALVCTCGTAAAAVAVAAGPARRAAAPEGLLLVEFLDYVKGWPWWRVTLLSPAGKRLPVPERVRKFPHELSPDGRMVAGVRDGKLLLGPVRGGALKTILRGVCARPYPHLRFRFDRPESRRRVESRWAAVRPRDGSGRREWPDNREGLRPHGQRDAVIEAARHGSRTAGRWTRIARLSLLVT
jgi:hypothetical protein